MGQDHRKNTNEAIMERLNSMSKKLNDYQNTLDNLFHHVAGFARHLKMEPKDLVVLIHDVQANYAYLSELMKEEQILQKSQEEKIKEWQKSQPSAETMDAIKSASILPESEDENVSEINQEPAAEAAVSEGK